MSIDIEKTRKIFHDHASAGVVRITTAVLEELVSDLEDAQKFQKELAEATDTIHRFRDRFRSAEKQIAKARKLYRDGDLAEAYLALDWRQR